MRRFFICLSFIFVLTGCGFHLRGLVDMPPWVRNVAIVIEDANRDLGGLLKDQLEAYAVPIASNATLATFLLIIERDQYRQEITNVSASTTPRQYLLVYDVQFTFTQAKNTPLISSGHVLVTRYVTINNDRILGSDAEEALLKNEMRVDAARQIINRISQANCVH